MNIKTHYEDYWRSKKSEDEFFDYERNIKLSGLFLTGEKVLDLGGGDGVVGAYLQKNIGVNLICADISKEALIKARKKGLKTVYLNAESKLPFKNNEFDKVFWGDNVEHLFSPEDALSEIKRVLKKNGKLILSCPNLGYFRYRISFLLNGCLPDTEWTGNKPWAWSHIRFFNLAILKEFLFSGGFSVKDVIGINRRVPDRFLLSLSPSMFGMILLLVAEKR